MPKGYIEYQDRIGSQHELTTPGNRKSDVVISAIEKCEKLEKEIKQLRQLLKDVRKLWKGTIFMPETQEQVRDVLTRVNSIIGESEE